MRKDTLYVSDLDGTLLDTTANISDNSRAMLAEAIHSGAMFTVATARTPATVHPIMAGLPSAAFTDTATGIRQALPAIVMTGAATWDRTLERYDTVRLIPAEYVEPILDAFGRAGLRPFTYCLSGERFLNVYHTRAMDRREETFYRERRHLQLKRFHLDQHPASPANVVLFFATGPDTQVEHACRLLNEATPCAAAWYRDIVTPSTGLVDIYAPGVSKARAVQELAARTGARRIVVFGDNLNDLPMMRVADVAVAVGNALPAVKEEATVVTGPNTADSVARFIIDDK